MLHSFYTIEIHTVVDCTSDSATELLAVDGKLTELTR